MGVPHRPVRAVHLEGGGVMDFAYHLEEQDKDEHGHWQPRLVWGDGLVMFSLGRLKAESWQQAVRELAQWNWNYCISAEDAARTIAVARLSNATLSVREDHHGAA